MVAIYHFLHYNKHIPKANLIFSLISHGYKSEYSLSNRHESKGEINMKKIIRNNEYDTETAVLIKKHTVGYFGDPAGYEESLYQTPKGLFFVYASGGPESPYAVEKITCVSKAKADVWVAEH